MHEQRLKRLRDDDKPTAAMPVLLPLTYRCRLYLAVREGSRFAVDYGERDTERGRARKGSPLLSCHKSM